MNVLDRYSKFSLGMVRRNLEKRDLDHQLGKGIGALATFLGLESEYYRPQFVGMILRKS